MPIIVGRRPIYEALKANKKFEKIFVLYGAQSGSIGDILNLARKKNVKVVELGKQKFRDLTRNKATQGIAAIIAERSYSAIEDLFKAASDRNEVPVLLMLDNINDPHNLGALIRSAECMGVHGVIIPKDRSAGLNSAAVKSSAGADAYMKISKVINLARTIDELKEKGFWIVGTSSLAEKTIDDVDVNLPLVLVLGSEGKGMRKLTESKCDFLIKIPLYGKIESLNVSVAGGILMYEIRKRRSHTGITALSSDVTS